MTVLLDDEMISASAVVMLAADTAISKRLQRQVFDWLPDIWKRIWCEKRNQMQPMISQLSLAVYLSFKCRQNFRHPKIRFTEYETK
jgi:hypothetical protein